MVATRRVHGQDAVDFFADLPPNEADYRDEVIQLAARLMAAEYTLDNYARYNELERVGESSDYGHLFDDYWVRTCIDATSFLFRDELLVNVEELAAYLQSGVEQDVLSEGTAQDVLQLAERAEFVQMDYFNRDKISLLLQDLYIKGDLSEDVYYGAQAALDMFDSDKHWANELAALMVSREAQVVVGNCVYRLVEAQEPDEKKEEPQAPQGVDEKLFNQMMSSFGTAESRIETEIDRAKLDAQDPYMGVSRKGVRYHVVVNPRGALDGSKSYLTFDMGNSLAENLLAKKWDKAYQNILQLGEKGNIAQVVWNYEGNQMVGTVPEFWEKMLVSIADLQKFDARVKGDVFGEISPGEENELKLMDWLLNVAQQMAEHGIGAESFVNFNDVNNLISQLVEEKVLNVNDNNNLTYLLGESKDETTGQVNLNVFYRNVRDELVRKNLISTSKAKDLVARLEGLDPEPVNYFERDRFYALVEQGKLEGVFSDEEVANARRALDAFGSDSEWREALRNKIERNVSLTVPKEEVVKAVDKWASQSGYKIESGVQVTLTDENTVVAAIKAPFPFFYTFDVGDAGELTLQEAAMVFFDREVFVTPDKGGDSPVRLLEADKILAKALDNAVQFEMGKTTELQDPDKFTNKLVTQIAKKQQAPTDEAQ